MKCASETIISAFSYKETLKCTLKMILSVVEILYILFFFCLNFKLCYSACSRAEYEIDGECCPMCAPGNRVYRHCTDYTSTTCDPCIGATFLDVPNGRTMCFDCSECEPGKGLRVRTACTRTSDTVCEPLQGYYCTEQHRGSCIRAKEHTKCQPGEYIQHMGTADKDAVCEKCGEGTFSNGTLQKCQPHSECEDQGLIEVKPGTADSDTECGNKSSVIFIILIIVFLALAVIFSIILIKKCKNSTSPDNVMHLGLHKISETISGVTHFGKSTQSDRSSDPNTPLRRPEETSEQDVTTPQHSAADTADFTSDGTVLKSDEPVQDDSDSSPPESPDQRPAG